jgi:seryl-tRNA synthetase
MTKQQVDARRAVTETDLQLVDRAIADHEVFQKDLYVLRRVLGEIGKLDEQYRGVKQGIEAVQAEGANISRQLEYAKEQLAKVQQEEVEKRKELAALTAEVQEKQRTLEAFTAQIEKITGRAA